MKFVRQSILRPGSAEWIAIVRAIGKALIVWHGVLVASPVDTFAEDADDQIPSLLCRPEARRRACGDA